MPGGPATPKYVGVLLEKCISLNFGILKNHGFYIGICKPGIGYTLQKTRISYLWKRDKTSSSRAPWKGGSVVSQEGNHSLYIQILYT